jgi:AraC-like DNA-binding protein
MECLSSGYRVDANGRFSIGYVGRRGFQVRRGTEHHRMRPGDLTVWDTSAAHHGSPLDDGPWIYRSVALELPDVTQVLSDPDHCVVDLPFPDPIVRDQDLVDRFVRLHHLATQPASSLELGSSLAVWLQDLVARSPQIGVRRPRSRRVRRDPALRRACELLRDDPARNVSLDELAAAAGTSKFRLVRLFKAALGVAPHAYQIAVRVQIARRLLEQGVRATDAAARAGFADQSHLNRHFTRRMGLTPAAYVATMDGTSARPGQPARCPSMRPGNHSNG